MKFILLCILSVNTCFAGLKLSWNDNSDNEDGFKVERRIFSLGLQQEFVEIASVSSDIETYEDLETDSQKSTIFEYRVRAFNEITIEEEPWRTEPVTLYSGYTNTVWTSVNRLTPPNAPNSLNLTFDSIVINANNVIVNEN